MSASFLGEEEPRGQLPPSPAFHPVIRDLAWYETHHVYAPDGEVLEIPGDGDDGVWMTAAAFIKYASKRNL